MTILRKAALVFFLSVSGSPAYLPTTDELDPRLTSLSDDSCAFDWEGGEGRTDFVQWSDNLTEWRYLPTISHGVADYSIGVDSTTDRLFLRLRVTDLAIRPGYTPETEDFDGDGFRNLYEILNGRDPLVAETVTDTDEDGALDLTEQTMGTNPNHPDHPAVKLSVVEAFSQ